MKKNNIPEIICFILFCIGTIIISCFHEAWFDEFQAWGISKDSIYNILFVIPHLEGHPPLWHLILKCFSFFNVNCELGIKIPNLLFMFGAVWLLIFKSPFPRIVRLTLPFTYFIFYQYSIVSRPYSIFCFAIFLAALFYKERNEHPYKFVFALALLCLSSAYGMVISAGVILVWFIEILSIRGISVPLRYSDSDIAKNPNVIARAESSWQSVIYKFIKDKRFYAMFIIFLLCVALVAIMYPDKDILYTSIFQFVIFYKRILYSFFIFPADALFYNTSDYFILSNLNNIDLKFLIGIICGISVNIFLFFIFKIYKKRLFFFIPYILLLIFFTLYASAQHIGILTIMYIFSFWCVMNEIQIKLYINARKILCIFIAFIILIQLSWTINASFNEIKYPYCSSKNLAAFIKKNKLYKYKIMAKVTESSHYNNQNRDRVNVLNQFIAVVINPYFDRNIVYSFSIINQNKNYCILRKKSNKEEIEIIEKLRSYGFPDIILNQSTPEGIFSDEELKNIKYVYFADFPNYHIWKNSYTKYYDNVYIKSDLY